MNSLVSDSIVSRFLSEYVHTYYLFVHTHILVRCEIRTGTANTSQETSLVVVLFVQYPDGPLLVVDY